METLLDYLGDGREMLSLFAFIILQFFLDIMSTNRSPVLGIYYIEFADAMRVLQ